MMVGIVAVTAGTACASRVRPARENSAVRPSTAATGPAFRGPSADRSANASGWRRILGAYAGPGTRGIAGLREFERWSGVQTAYALDFAPADSWTDLTGPGWQLAAWASAGRRLIYSVPMFPHPDGASPGGEVRNLLDDCAAGVFDGHWTELATRLVARGLADTIVRPGWEFNGDWYPWASRDREAEYASCFRHVAQTMRTVAGGHFSYLWNPAIGKDRSSAEKAYPGDAYVDFVGVDLYDTSWTANTYPLAPGATLEQRIQIQRRTWSEDHEDLRFWVKFATTHGRPLAIPEWGLSERSDGHGGGDNTYFIDRVLQFIGDPANRVAFAMYFDVDVNLDSGGFDRHQISAPTSAFPSAGRRFQTIVG
jgi:hypothetical protein